MMAYQRSLTNVTRAFFDMALKDEIDRLDLIESGNGLEVDV